MKLTGDVIIPEAKLTRYLLVPQEHDDKITSRFPPIAMRYGCA